MGTDSISRPGATRMVGPAALLLAVLGAWPALAATKAPVKHPPAGATLSLDGDGATEHLRANTLSSFAPDLIDSSKFSFTAPGQANARLATAERAFRFTPSGKVDSRRAFSVGVTSRVAAPVVDTSRAAAVPVEVAAATPAPAAYNVDLAVGWRNFAVSGGYARSDTTGALPQALSLSLAAPRREAVDAGLSYRGTSWKTSVEVAAEEGPALLLNPFASPSPSTIDRRYSLEVGGAYLLTPRLSVTGGLKYKETVSPTDPLRRDQAVYLGTAFTF